MKLILLQYIPIIIPERGITIDKIVPLGIILCVIGALLCLFAYIFNRFNVERSRDSDLWLCGIIIIIASSAICFLPILIVLLYNLCYTVCF